MAGCTALRGHALGGTPRLRDECERQLLDRQRRGAHRGRVLAAAGTIRRGRLRAYRQNLAVLEGDTPNALDGEDGVFNLEELRVAALDNGAFTVDQWLTGVVDRCEAVPTPVRSEDLSDENGDVVVPARDVVLAEACTVLGKWDGHYDIESVGAVLWREFTEQVAYEDLWAEPFDPENPTTTPAGLAPAPVEGPDPVLVGLADAVALLDFAGVAVDAPLGAMQYDARVEGQRPPVPGGLGSEGITNVVSDGRQSSSTTQEQPSWPERLIDGSTLTTDGYPISYGSSFMLAVEMGPDGPDGYTILTYGQVGDPALPGFTAGVEAFADKQWKPALFTLAEIEADTATVAEVSGSSTTTRAELVVVDTWPMSDDAASNQAGSDEQAKEELEAIRATVEGFPSALATAARLNEGVVEATTLDIRALHLVRLAALAASDAPPVAFRVNLEAMDQHVSVEDVNSIEAIAPIIGTARDLSGSGDHRRLRFRGTTSGRFTWSEGQNQSTHLVVTPFDRRDRTQARLQGLRRPAPGPGSRSGQGRRSQGRRADHD